MKILECDACGKSMNTRHDYTSTVKITSVLFIKKKFDFCNSCIYDVVEAVERIAMQK